MKWKFWKKDHGPSYRAIKEKIMRESKQTYEWERRKQENQKMLAEREDRISGAYEETIVLYQRFRNKLTCDNTLTYAMMTVAAAILIRKK